MVAGTAEYVWWFAGIRRVRRLRGEIVRAFPSALAPCMFYLFCLGGWMLPASPMDFHMGEQPRV
jgi:hypothetical protein